MQFWQPTRGILQPNQHWVRGQVPPAGAGTTWNPADKSTQIDLADADLTMTANATSGGFQQVRSVATRAYGSGKFYCEMTMVYHAVVTVENMGFGVASKASHSFSNYLGQSGNSAGIFPTSTTGRGVISGAQTELGCAGIPGHVWAMAFDATTPLVWFRNLTTGSNWNNSGTANPATGVGGYAGALGGGAGWCILTEADSYPDTWTLNAGSSAYVGTPPSGFVNW